MSTLLQKERGTARKRIIGELWGTPSCHVGTLDPGKVNSTSGRPRMATDTRLQPRDTAPRASRPALAQRGELLGKHKGEFVTFRCNSHFVYVICFINVSQTSFPAVCNTNVPAVA